MPTLFFVVLGAWFCFPTFGCKHVCRSALLGGVQPGPGWVSLVVKQVRAGEEQRRGGKAATFGVSLHSMYRYLEIAVL